jgi:hypothetical protein
MMLSINTVIASNTLSIYTAIITTSSEPIPSSPLNSQTIATVAHSTAIFSCCTISTYSEAVTPSK